MSAEQARSIIILSQGGLSPDDADSRTVRQILALQQIKQNCGFLRGHVVAELQVAARGRERERERASEREVER